MKLTITNTEMELLTTATEMANQSYNKNDEEYDHTADELLNELNQFLTGLESYDFYIDCELAEYVTELLEA